MRRVVTERKQLSKPKYQSHEKKLVWLSFIVAAIMLLSIIGRLVSG
ncbi:hypothetical protein H8S33_14385 [Ornithinibacillus sp. BX22]|uniref:Uncharacterized protein n=2 Tax=Ornithinibacillus TaxID=484508 RepID=A0A923L7L5_9BACI|nr:MULTISPECIES: hypothetical protein [Ornithinibacillus]MBC5637981.1 hypothetical protein [Ornithinibacillus hominis]MBS3681869.1 hypothetical protein [Ornithinibacillus massiliensis]